MKTLIIKKKHILIVLAFIVCCGFCLGGFGLYKSIKANSQSYIYTVVIDAGHGGFDVK